MILLGVFLLLFLVCYSFLQFGTNTLFQKLAFATLAIAITVLFAVTAEVSAEQIGASNYQKGLVLSAPIAAVVFIVTTALARHAKIAAWFLDERNKAQNSKAVLKKLLLEIPLVTVLVEELLFRGLLFWFFEDLWGQVAAILLSSIIFGFWHILPSLHFNRKAAISMDSSIGTIIGTIVITASFGIALSLLRVVSGSLLTPIVIHYAVNASGYLASVQANNTATR